VHRTPTPCGRSAQVCEPWEGHVAVGGNVAEGGEHIDPNESTDEDEAREHDHLQHTHKNAFLSASTGHRSADARIV
jgi:hypothetical protein